VNLLEAMYGELLQTAHELRRSSSSDTAAPLSVLMLSYGPQVEGGGWSAFAELRERWVVRERREQVTGRQETLLICDLDSLQTGTRAMVVANTSGVVINNLIFRAALRDSLVHPYSTVFALEATGETWDGSGLRSEEPLLPVPAGGGTGGTPAPSSGLFIIGETPSGAVNGSNATFTTAYDFIPETVEVQVNGLVQRPVADFITTGTRTITLTSSPQPGETIQVDYQRA
jgi:hypothetical protein